MPDNLTLQTNEEVLRARQGQRLVDIGLRRIDGRTDVCHYLMIEVPDSSRAVNPKVIEPYRDLERAVAVARHCKTGGRPAKCLGGFTLTFRDGKILGAKVIDLNADVMPVTPIRSRNLLAEDE